MVYIILNGILINNVAYFPLNSEIHTKLTKHTKCLYVQQEYLLLYQKGVYYISIQVFNNLPNWTTDLVQNKKIYGVSCWGNQHVWDTIWLFT